MPCVLHVATLLLLAGAGLAQAKVDLVRARALLQSPGEKDVHEGTDLCVKANDVPAVELMLETMSETERRTRMHLAPGHYRDIVWDGLLRITDPYARRRVELELKQGRDPRVRQWCGEALGIYGNVEFGATLRKALSAKDDDVVRWCVRALGMMKCTDAARELATMTRTGNDYVRANVIEALARIDVANVPALIAAIAADKSGGVRCALLGALPELGSDRLEEVCTTALRDADWRPRMQAVQNLGQIKTKSAVDSLIVALRDGRPVVAQRALHELQQLTGQPIQQVEMWEKWWPDNREKFAFPEKRGVVQRAGGTVAYNGVPVDSDHVAFLLDKCVMMQQALTSKAMTKEAAAIEELARVLQALGEKITFNVVNYHVTVDFFEKKPVKLTAKTRERAIAFAKAKSDGREKDIWQALASVVPDATLDTVYLLSSGEPDTGLYVHWNRVTRHLADLNRFHKVTVHTVAYTDNEWFRDQLQKIAEVTGGHFEWLK